MILLQESMSDDLYYPLDYHLCDLKVKGAASDPWYWKRRERFSRDFPCSTVQPSWAGLEIAQRATPMNSATMVMPDTTKLSQWNTVTGIVKLTDCRVVHQFEI